MPKIQFPSRRETTNLRVGKNPIYKHRYESEEGFTKEDIIDNLKELRDVYRKISKKNVRFMINVFAEGLGKWVSGKTTTIQSDEFSIPTQYHNRVIELVNYFDVSILPERQTADEVINIFGKK